MKITIFCCFILSTVVACQTPSPENEGLLPSELDKVVKHYQQEEDSMKLRAAHFLIDHMPLHQTYSSLAKETYDSALFHYLSELPDSVVANLPFAHPLVSPNRFGCPPNPTRTRSLPRSLFVILIRHSPPGLHYPGRELIVLNTINRVLRIHLTLSSF